MPFTTEQFFDVFASYNRAVWPAPVIMTLAAVAVIVLALRPARGAGRVITVILGALWLWMGAIYHLAFFSRVNQAAILFGAVFLVQGLLLLVVGGAQGRLSFHARANFEGWSGGLLAVYALVVYPLVGGLSGHLYPAAPTFGVPCPTTILTFAVLLWADRRVPGYLLVIPFLWSVIGLSAVFNLGVVQDAGLFLAGLAGTVLILRRNRRLDPRPLGAR